MRIQCCVCKKVEHDGGWKSAPEHYHDASHTYCPACARDAWADIRAFKESYAAPKSCRVRAGSLQDIFQSAQPLKRLDGNNQHHRQSRGYEEGP